MHGDGKNALASVSDLGVHNLGKNLGKYRAANGHGKREKNFFEELS
jgi:hypothetical protein